MADTLANIQTDARLWADDSQLTLTSGDGLRVFNLVYQGLMNPEFEMAGIKVGRRWPEASRQDTSLTMVVGTEEYDWPTTTVFKPPWYIEGLDANNSDLPYTIWPVESMQEWSYFASVTNGRPKRYRLYNNAGTIKMALRPKPYQTDGVRISGLIEVTELTGSGDSTIFLNKASDRALSMLVAAYYQSKRGDRPGRAQELIALALGLLPKVDMTPMIAKTGYSRPWTV